MVVGEKDRQLVTRWIEPHPWKGGAAEALLRDSGIAVWAIVGYLGGEAGDPAAAAEAYDIPVEAVEAALAYYREHRGALDERLAANEPPSRDRVPS